MDWQIEKGTRCDLVFYAARNLTGKRTEVRIFPQGNRQGDVHTRDLQSCVVRAPYGTRVVFLTAIGTGWEAQPWRCVRLVEGHALRSEGVGLPGVRLPDLDLLDTHGAKRTDPDRETTFVRAANLEAGTDWTFGCPGELKGKVIQIRVEKDLAAAAKPLGEAEQLARAVLNRLGREHVEPVAEALTEVLRAVGHVDPEARAAALRSWAG